MRKLRIIGYGTRGPHQITLEGIRELRAAELVLYFSAPGWDESWLGGALGARASESLDGLYGEGEVDVVSYERIVARILEALAEHGDVAFLLPGHPRLGSSIVAELDRRAASGAYTVRVVEGISSFDTMVNDAGRDILEAGSVVLDANRLLLHRYRLDPRLDHYVYHVCSVATARVHKSRPDRGNHLGLLADYLLETFPRDHPVTLLSSRREPGGAGHVATCRLSELPAALPKITFDTSLFVPAIRAGELDPGVAALIEESAA